MPGGWDGRLCRQADRYRCSAERCGTRMRQLLEGSTESAARPLSNLINIDRLACSQFAANLKRVEAATRSPSGGRQDATVRASAAQLSTRLGPVGIHAFHPCWAVLHDSDGPLCADGRPMGED